jgi:FtsP/CotA-like multicopper oxidase with cupredoxin domain
MRTALVSLCVWLSLYCLSVPSFAADTICPRPAPGSVVTQPEDLFSHKGVLNVTLNYETTVDDNGNTLFCYMLPDGNQSPTLHIHPGDHLVVTLVNDTPQPSSSTTMAMQMNTSDDTVCGATTADDSSTNIHFHGTNTSPVCHQDDVIHTLVNSGESFTYNVAFPKNEPPGLYWYHPHVHGLSEAAVLGGASGAIVVDGIQNLQPAVAGLPQRILLVRDNLVPGVPTAGGGVPSWDISLNYIPVPYPDYPPAVIPMKAGAKQLWRLVNACADTILDIQLQYDGTPQALKIVALDGVPTGSQDGSRHGTIVTKTDILIPPAGRAEFIVTGPEKGVQNAILLTQNIDTGPDGDDDPTRPIASIQTQFTAASSSTPTASAAVTSAALDKATAALPAIPSQIATANPQRFEGLAKVKPVGTRVLYFSEVLSDPNDPNSPTDFFITVDGDTPTLFDPANPPAITTTQGSVEDWTIENRSLENHEFHIHQIHFLLLDRNGVPVPKQDQQMLDMVQVPYWSGSGPDPSVTVRMDFRGPDIGDFVYHCHILGHEDAGMMAIIRVVPKPNPLLEGPEALFDWLFPTPAHPLLATCVRGRTSYVRRSAIAQPEQGTLKRLGGMMVLIFATVVALPRSSLLRQLLAFLRRGRPQK